MEPDRPVTIDDIQLYIRAMFNQSQSHLEKLFDDFRRENIDSSWDRDFMIDHVIKIKVQKEVYEMLKEINENLRDPKIYRDIAAEKYPTAGVVEDIEPRKVEQGEWLFGKTLNQQELLATVITFDMHWCIVCKRNKSLYKLTHATCDDDKCIAKLINSIDEDVSEKLSELNMRENFEPPYFRLPWKMETRNKLLELLKPHLEETEA